MGTTADKLNKLLETKQAIKQAIIDKGVDVSDDTVFADYPSKINSIESGEGGGDPYYENLYNMRTNNGTNMSGLYAYCTASELDLSNLDTSKATNMDNMFNYCGSLTSLDLNNFNTSNVTNMSYMLYGCSNLVSVNTQDWDTSKVHEMSGMFYQCTSLPSLDLSNWDTSGVISASYMFGDCYSLALLDLSNWNLNSLTGSYDMFGNCTSLHTLRLDNCSNDTINKIITSENFSTDAIEGVTRTIYCKEENAAGLTPPTNWVFSFIEEELEPEPTVNPNEIKFRLTGAPASSIITVNGSSKTLSDLTYDSITDIYSYDAGVPITSVKFNSYLGELVKLNTSNITSMADMFNGCTNLTTLDVSNFDTSNVNTMDFMIYNCYNLTTLDLSNFNTSNVTSMGGMFADCKNLISLDLSNFDTSNVTFMYNMFYKCTSLQELHLDNCSNDTISKIITSYNFPTNAIEGQVRTIYCKEENAADLTPPTNWVFSFIGESETPDGPEEPIEPEDNYITFAVEKFTLGLGYLQEPIRLPFYENDTYADVVVRTLGEENVQWSDTFIWGIRDDDTREPNVPQYILDEIGSADSRNEEGWLSNCDYMPLSMWMCSVNNNFLDPYTSLSEFTPNKDDVFRIQFSLYYGEDITNGSIIEIANRDKLTEQIALINSSEDKKDLLKDKKIKEAYDDAYDYLEDLIATQEEVDSALNNLENAMNK